MLARNDSVASFPVLLQRPGSLLDSLDLLGHFGVKLSNQLSAGLIHSFEHRV